MYRQPAGRGQTHEQVYRQAGPVHTCSQTALYAACALSEDFTAEAERGGENLTVAQF
jgi:hypothetical protein